MPAAPPAVRRAPVVPLAPGRFKLQVTTSRETCEKPLRAQDEARSIYNGGEPGWRNWQTLGT
jgi:hypothetical protein